MLSQSSLINLYYFVFVIWKGVKFVHENQAASEPTKQGSVIFAIFLN